MEASTPWVPALLSLVTGVGLASACGFRVFLPLLVAGVAARTGAIPLAGGFEWLQSLPALLALSVATVLEVGAYFVPWVDHALDAVATPAAVLAGILASASVVTALPPGLKWTIAIVGGGGAAGLIQGASVLLRLKSAALTGGLGNPAIAAAELTGALVTSLLAVLLPLLGLATVLFLVIISIRAGRLRFGRPPRTQAIRGGMP
jgi:Domain of unknown function (DUF4126)